jgi:hypothetical protein
MPLCGTSVPVSARASLLPRPGFALETGDTAGSGGYVRAFGISPAEL